MVIFLDLVYPNDHRAVGSSVAFLWWYQGKWMDFFRIKEMRQPKAPNVVCSNNEFLFDMKCETD